MIATANVIHNPRRILIINAVGPVKRADVHHVISKEASGDDMHLLSGICMYCPAIVPRQNESLHDFGNVWRV